MSSYATSSLQISDCPKISPFFFRVMRMLALFTLFFGLAGPSYADPELAVEKAVYKAVAPYEKEGFDFRADVWVRELGPEVGKAVRLQMFKGNEYRVIFSLGPKSKGSITGQILDAQGTPIASKIERTRDGKTLILHVTPKKTGLHMGIVRLEEGATESVLCGMIAGYK